MNKYLAIDCVDFCKALADPTRQQILQMLLKREMSVGEIVGQFQMTQPTISHHLDVLKRYNLLKSRKDGKQVYYVTNQEQVVTCCGRLVAKFELDEGDS